jgi:acyl-CoA synthetase (AMP-forming)/AMP-acid ligase II
MNLVEILRGHAFTRPDAAAILDRHGGSDRTTTFAQLERGSSQAATLLWQAGLRPGDAVLVLHPMSAELYVALLALFRLGMIAVFLDPSAGKDYMERCCALQRPRGLIADVKAHLLRLWSPALRHVPLKFVIGLPVPGAIGWSRLKRLPPHAEVHAGPSETPALLTFTSGSTGQPKAVVRTHGFLLAQHRALEESLELQAGDVDLTTLPIVLLANLASGVTSLVPDADLRTPGAIVPGPVVAQVQRHEAVSSTASPAFFECLARHCVERGLSLPTFRKLYSGGAPVFPRLLDQVQAMAPGANVVAVYGSTEAEPIAHVARREIRPEDLQAMLDGRGLLAGRPVETIRLRILPDEWGRPVGPWTAAEFDAACLPAGQPGEIVVSGEHVLPGYLHGDGDEDTKFRVDGVVWHRTGDAGYVDPQGRAWLLGRCAARIQDEHGELYPFAAEAAAYQEPRIRRAAMVGRAGRRVLAVEFYDDRDPPGLDCLRDRLAWTHLDEVRVCARIPVDKRHNAKIDYPGLYRLLDHPPGLAGK